jgi:exodeoxyribonuclease V
MNDSVARSAGEIEFNEQQKNAIAAAVDWFKGYKAGKHFKQVFFLAGYAGTGKTTVAQTIADLCVPNGKVVFIAPTGKAASRLKQKGCIGAKTLHAFVYNFRGEDEDGDPIFIEKGTLDERPALVVCDEVSMLGEYDNRALLAFGIPVLALGDIGQVDPVKAKAVYVEGTEDVCLTDIMRQEADSNIVRASFFVRQGKRLPPREYEDVRVRTGEIPLECLLEHATEEAQIICSFNATRSEINTRVRAALGFEGALPNIGEKIVCTFNQHGFGIMNGEVGIVQGYEEPTADEIEKSNDDGLRVILKSLTDNKVRRVHFNPLAFTGTPDERKDAVKSFGGFDYGFALTIHKSQGSEWDNVLVVEERAFGNYAKLMYTAVTRAAKRLTIYRAR